MLLLLRALILCFPRVEVSHCLGCRRCQMLVVGSLEAAWAGRYVECARFPRTKCSAFFSALFLIPSGARIHYYSVRRPRVALKPSCTLRVQRYSCCCCSSASSKDDSSSNSSAQGTTPLHLHFSTQISKLSGLPVSLSLTPKLFSFKRWCSRNSTPHLRVSPHAVCHVWLTWNPGGVAR